MSITVIKRNGSTENFEIDKIETHVLMSCEGLPNVSSGLLLAEVFRQCHNGMTTESIQNLIITTAAERISLEAPDWTYVAARATLQNIYKEVTGGSFRYPSMRSYLKKGIKEGVLVKSLLKKFDLKAIDEAIKPERDNLFKYLGILTVSDRYLVRDLEGKILELPQHFWMRVAMGLSLSEHESVRMQKCLEFYEVMSTMEYIPSTPTLFNSGTLHPQLSSCYLLSMGDDTQAINDTNGEASHDSKFAGGVAIDMSPVRCSGSYIRSTRGRSSGIVPYAHILNGIFNGFDQSGRRKGAGAIYLTDWHGDIEEFLNLVNPTGDFRRRAPDLFPAIWHTDLFMKRVEAKGNNWSLFSPNTNQDLLTLYGEEFEQAYLKAEESGQAVSVISADELWQKMIGKRFENGRYFACFKDTINKRRMQLDGVVRSSNLCCIAGDQLVATTEGLYTVKELYDLQKPVKVPGLDGIYDASVMYLPRPNAPMGVIRTKQGYSHKVTPDHKVWVKDTGWVEAKDLKKGDTLLLQQVATFSPKSGITDDLAFIMGLVAGDGTYGQDGVRIDLWDNKTSHLVMDVEVAVSEIISAHPEVWDESPRSNKEPTFTRVEDAGKYSLNSVLLAKILASYGFTKETKLQVPALVKRNEASAKSYLSGLFLTDGTVSSIQGEGAVASLASASKPLLEEAQVLLMAFGIKSSLTLMRGETTKPMPDGNGGTRDFECQPIHRLMVTSIRGCSKLEHLTGIGEHRVFYANSSKEYLVQIDKAGYEEKFHCEFISYDQLPNEDAYCLTVDSDTHAWTVNGFITKNTEITLNTEPSGSDDVISAVCNLGSINLSKVCPLDNPKRFEFVVKTGSRMLNNVVDDSFVPHANGRKFNVQDKAVGMGIMGYAEWLVAKGIDFESQEHLDLANDMMKYFAYYNIEASADLAQERGSYPGFENSRWARGELPKDTAWESAISLTSSGTAYNLPGMDEAALRIKVAAGMRNSHTMAIAPTATIANIVGTTECTQLPYELMYQKENLSGKFWVIAPTLLYPATRYQDARNVSQEWSIKAAAVRQIHLDQSQSTNLYLPTTRKVKGSEISSWYFLAWNYGVKTLYYLKGVSAKEVVQVAAESAPVEPEVDPLEAEVKFCSIANPECESCQ